MFLLTLFERNLGLKKLFKDGGLIFQLITYAMLIVSVMFLTICGAGLYRSVNSNRDFSENIRDSLSYIQSQILNENSDRIEISEGPEGDMLVFENSDEGYNILIYCFGGSLCEEISAGKDYHTERAEEICEAEELKTSIENGLISVHVDNRFTCCAVRCGGSEGGE